MPGGPGAGQLTYTDDSSGVTGSTPELLLLATAFSARGRAEQAERRLLEQNTTQHVPCRRYRSHSLTDSSSTLLASTHTTTAYQWV